ncbi:hypothetical protein Tco_1428456 [Tanacetum coccineum]
MVGVDINTLTMEQYLALLRENQAPGVVKPEFRGNVNFEIKSQFMRELREDTFSRNKNEDADDHVDRVLSIACSIFPEYHKTQYYYVCSCSLLLDSLKDGWIDSLQELSILGTSLKSLYPKWHDGTSCRIISSNSDTDGLTAVIRPHLDKECPLNKEVKQVDEVKYGEFRRPAPFNENSGAKFRIGPPGYY